jgi:hypothetical protein
LARAETSESLLWALVIVSMLLISF